MALSAPDVPLWLARAGTPLAVALGAVMRVRFRRRAVAWWDVIVVGLALYCGLLAVIGWACLAVRGLR